MACQAGSQADYDTGQKIVSVLLTIFLPVIALVAALVSRGTETNPARRAALRA